MNCPSGKHPYESPHAAGRAADALRRKKWACRVYRCDHCHLWHTTKMEETTIRKRKEKFLQ